MKSISFYFLAFAFIIAGCKSNNNLNSPISKEEKMTTAIKNSKSIAANAKAAIFKSYNEAEVRKYFNQDYIQHNPNVPTGIEPIIGLLPTLKEKGTTFKTHRVFQDGDFVVMHNSFSNAEPLGANEVVTFDIWKLENGKIAEHWDAVTPFVKETASGRSQIDGPVQVTDLDKTEINKAIVKKLVDEVFIGGNTSNITDYISTEQYDQHNPMVSDGLAGLTAAIEYLSSQNNMFKYHKVHKLLGEGSYVIVQAEGEWNQKPHVFYDLFRLKDGKVVEHWDVVNEIPEQMAHDNGIF